MSTAGSIVNDGSPATTQIIESTVSGDGSSAVTLTNDGVFVNGNASHPGSFSSDGGLFTTDGSGNVTCSTLTTGATSVIAVSGNTILSASATNKIGTAKIGSFSFFTIASTTAGSHAYNHGFTGTPAFFLLSSTTESPNYTVTAWNSTTVTINFANAGQAYTGVAIG